MSVNVLIEEEIFQLTDQSIHTVKNLQISSTNLISSALGASKSRQSKLENKKIL